MYSGNFVKIAGGFGDELIQIRQRVTLYRGCFDAGVSVTMSHRDISMGWYMLVISGEVKVQSEILSHRDAYMSDDSADLTVFFEKDSEILLFDVAMR
jgi:hypothetical protein